MLYVIFFVILSFILFNLFGSVNTQFKQKDNIESTRSTNNYKPSKIDLTDIYKDIYLEPYGCFSSLDEKFFMKEINKYSKRQVYDSGILISESRASQDPQNLITKVIDNGFEEGPFIKS
jgi:hypothetical protein